MMKLKTTSYLGIMCIFMLLNIYLLLQNLDLKSSIAEVKKSRTTSTNTFPTFSLPELKALRTTPGYAKLSLFVFFSPADCAGCLDEARLWERLNKQFSQEGFSVIGIADHTTRQELNRFVKLLGANFPIYLDKSGSIKQQLRLTFSPAKIFVDNNKNILRIDTTGSFSEEQERWYKQASEFISTYLKK